MVRRDLSHRDASSHAASELEYVIKREKRTKEPVVPSVTVEQAMTDTRVFSSVSNRDVTRVLFISRDTNLLNPTQQTLDGFVDISELFDEVHILILREGIPPKKPVIRVSDNVWIYTVSTRHWWQCIGSGLEMIESQLVFASGFRPDLIVARDPFESAVVAYKAGEKYGRSTQLHVLEDYTTKDFLQKNSHNFWRQYMPHFTVPKFLSVRTETSALQSFLQRKFTIPDIDRLPRFQDYDAMLNSDKSIDLKAKYRSFVFIILFVGKLTYNSTLHQAIDAARFVLKNPRVGMIVLGDGPAQDEFKKRAKIQEIENQVVFENKVTDVEPYLRSANLMIVTDTDSDSEDVVMKGAAAGIPMVMTRTERRDDIFVHGESAFLCESADIQSLTDRIDDLLNDIDLRKQFVSNGKDIIRRKFHSDPGAYRESYRTSIEQAFFVETDEQRNSVDDVDGDGKDDSAD
ncbi:glycosyltransferase family 4 protein [Candidatus Nomurabacteria bacterium]|nr:glycosyltransferase family 4 protein [Candidatus Nomurabacteria bacterium]